MAWIIVGLYIFIVLVVWPIVTRSDYKKYYGSAQESIGIGLLIAVFWPLTAITFALHFIWTEILPKLFRLD